MADAFEELAGRLREDGVGSMSVFRWECGRVAIGLDPMTLAVWGQIVVDLAGLLSVRDPIVGVVVKRPFGDDEVQNAAWDLIAGEDLREARLRRCNEVLRSIRDGFISPEAVDAWLMVCNDVRMVIAGPDMDAEMMQTLYESEHPRGVIVQLATALQAELLEIC